MVEKLKANDVVVFTRHTYFYPDINVEELKSLTQLGDIGVVRYTLNKETKFDYEIDIGGEHFVFYPDEIEKIGEL